VNDEKEERTLNSNFTGQNKILTYVHSFSDTTYFFLS
jgi:hypothetical protein